MSMSGGVVAALMFDRYCYCCCCCYCYYIICCWAVGGRCGCPTELKFERASAGMLRMLEGSCLTVPTAEMAELFIILEPTLVSPGFSSSCC